MAKPAMTSFILEARNPQRAEGHVIALESSPTERRVWRRETRGSVGALLSREAGPELWDM
jgi:hypothetical protein